MGVLAFISCLSYLVFSATIDGWGFPLDDAWIHHTYARNFAFDQSWSFQENQLSGGSTGPAWGLLLSVLYLAKISPLTGTYILGYLILYGTAIASYNLIRKILPGHKWLPLVTGMVITFEWHLVWAALSGMETSLLILLIMILFNWLSDKKENWWRIGLIIGFSAWIRPDGLTLAGPAIMSLLLRGYSRENALKQAGILILSLTAAVSTYFIFNWYVSGDIWPNTFYAKQAEYELLKQIPLISRYFRLSVQVITGVGALLLPGIIIQLMSILKEKSWDQLAYLIWSAGFIGLYAWFLPVTYQHGRYIMPAMPICFVLGAVGLARFVSSGNQQVNNRVVSRVWLGSTGIILFLFFFLGGQSYGMDVAIINSEMVRTSKWINANTEKGAVIAAHDIGALGYFSERELIDLAGLVTPDVIPFIRDESQLAAYMNEQEIDYLITFPSWYPGLTENLNVLYSTDGKYSPRYGMDNMTVYEWR